MIRRIFAVALALLLAGCVSGGRSADVVVRNATIYAGDGRAPFVGSVVVKDGTKFTTRIAV